MVPLVIVDTSVWVLYFRVPQSADGEEVERLITADEVAMVGVVYAELVQGARDKDELRVLGDRLEALPYLEAKKGTWRSAGQILLSLRRQGRTISVPDALIASLALEGGHQLYTLDEHFQRVPGLRLHEVKTG